MLVALLGCTALTLVRYSARSRRLAETQFRFAAGISHDLRTPLTAVRGAAFNLAEGIVNDPAAVSRYLRLILRNAEDLTAMIENVLAFSSMQSGARARSEAVDIRDALRRATEALSAEVEQAGCHLEIDIADDLPPVSGDAVAVELVFRNLIGNAARHGMSGKWIGVSAFLAGAAVEVRVSDRGPGVPENERRRIFEPFYRGEQTRARSVPGAGLGLSLVKNTIEQHRGTIRIESSPAGGACFTVRLPALHPVA
jgi:two-component system phosphate regulon sensor histidine kinase PhoR